MRSSRIAFVILSLLIRSAYASESSEAKSPGHIYGIAGCGLGAQIFQDDAQIFASTSNAISFNQSFAISFGTSGCRRHGTIKRSKQLAFFLATNQMALMTDSARGSGETLNALSQLFECSDSAQFGAKFKKYFGVLFPMTRLSLIHQTKQVCALVSQSADLQNQCHTKARSTLCVL